MPLSLGAEEAHREQHEIGFELELAARHRLELERGRSGSPTSTCAARAASSRGR